MKVKAVIFDLDDTLVSEREYINSGFKIIAEYMVSEYNLIYKNVLTQLLSLFEKSPKKVFNRFFESNCISYTSQEILKLVEIYREHKPTIELYQDVIPCLEKLKTNKYITGIISDGYCIGQKNKIKKLNLNKWFSEIILTDCLGKEYWKPSTKSFELIKKRFNLEYNEMLYIGDNINKDFIGIKTIGVRTIKIERSNGIYQNLSLSSDFDAEYKIANLNELFDILAI